MVLFLSRILTDEKLREIFEFEGEKINCYWLIPITEKERDFKIDRGSDALEQLFEDKHLDYLNPERDSLV